MITGKAIFWPEVSEPIRDEYVLIQKDTVVEDTQN